MLYTADSCEHLNITAGHTHIYTYTRTHKQHAHASSPSLPRVTPTKHCCLCCWPLLLAVGCWPLLLTVVWMTKIGRGCAPDPASEKHILFSKNEKALGIGFVVCHFPTRRHDFENFSAGRLKYKKIAAGPPGYSTGLHENGKTTLKQKTI